MTKGFALVAYPENWNLSGVMTFIVNHEGKVFQRNFGEETSHSAGALRVPHTTPLAVKGCQQVLKT